ncbi:MAG TPA: glycosyltransferase family 2 protein [Anaeromyxobacteraceae bacterium]
MRVSVVIPALDEEASIGAVIRSIPAPLVSEILVVDNGSTDRTAARALEAGARVVREPVRGYGRACRAGVEAVSPLAEVVVFLDGDGSDCPEVMGRLLAPLASGTHDFVIGSRVRGEREPGSMNLAQLLAGRLAGACLRLLYGVRYTDMGPFRAIRRDALAGLAMREETYGWNLEMQMKAARRGLRVLELPVPHRRRRGGRSKVSGHLAGTARAGFRILGTLARVALERRP